MGTMGKSMTMVVRIREICFQNEGTLQHKLQCIAKELADYLEAEVYFCEIRGRRWSFVAGSADVLCGSYRLRLSDKWGLISEREITPCHPVQLIISMIKEVLID